MKVGDSLGRSVNVNELPVKEESRIASDRAPNFRSHLTRAESSMYEQHLEKLIADIIRQGEILSSRIDIKELKKFRKLISEFLNTALGNSKKFSKQSLLDRKGRRKVYAIIRNVNDELDMLTQDVLNEEREHINILKRLEDIRGMILDLFM